MTSTKDNPDTGGGKRPADAATISRERADEIAASIRPSWDEYFDDAGEGGDEAGALGGKGEAPPEAEPIPASGRQRAPAPEPAPARPAEPAPAPEPAPARAAEPAPAPEPEPEPAPAPEPTTAPAPMAAPEPAPAPTPARPERPPAPQRLATPGLGSPVEPRRAAVSAIPEQASDSVLPSESIQLPTTPRPWGKVAAVLGAAAILIAAVWWYGQGGTEPSKVEPSGSATTEAQPVPPPAFTPAATETAEAPSTAAATATAEAPAEPSGAEPVAPPQGGPTGNPPAAGTVPRPVGTSATGPSPQPKSTAGTSTGAKPKPKQGGGIVREVPF